jgi:hypothetical protein
MGQKQRVFQHNQLGAAVLRFASIFADKSDFRRHSRPRPDIQQVVKLVLWVLGSGHSCTVQHFRGSEVSDVDKSAFTSNVQMATFVSCAYNSAVFFENRTSAFTTLWSDGEAYFF